MIYVSYFGMLLIALGVFLILTATIGLIRFPNFYARLHPAGIADSLGSAFILLGLSMQYEFSVFTIKIILLICFLWITGTASCQALAHSAYNSNDNNKKSN